MLCLLLIAIIASLASYFSMFKPIIDDAVASGTVNSYTEDPKLWAIVSAAFAGAIGIVTIVVLLVPDLNARVRATFTRIVNA